MTRTLLAAIVAAVALGGSGCCCTEMHTFRGGCEAPVGCNTCTGHRPILAHGGCSSCDTGCGSCNPCGGCGFGHGPIGTLVHGIFSGIGRALNSANGGCGDAYWHEWYSDPPGCNQCEPCHGHLLGRGNSGAIYGGAPMMSSPGKPGCASCGMSSHISTMPGSAAVVRVQQGPVMRNNQVMVQGAIASTPATTSQGPSVELPPGAIFISEQIISGPGANTTSNVAATVAARPVQSQSVQTQPVQVQVVQPQKAGTVYAKPASAVQPSTVYGARPQYYTRPWPAK